MFGFWPNLRPKRRCRETLGIEEEELQIKFLEVVEDSRCPRGVTCVWEGRVSCMIEITCRESLYRITLTQPGLTDWPTKESFNHYQISFGVEPYPEAGDRKFGNYDFGVAVEKDGTFQWKHTAVYRIDPILPGKMIYVDR